MEGCCAGPFRKDVAVDWLERGLGAGPGEDEVQSDVEVQVCMISPSSKAFMFVSLLKVEERLCFLC